MTSSWRTLAIGWACYAGFNILIFGLMGLFFAGIGGLVTVLPDSNTGEQAPAWVGLLFGSFGGGFACLVSLFMLPAVVAAWALWTHRPWARVLAGAVSVWSLFNMPIGTALGIWTLYVLFKDGVDLSRPPPG